jgi:acetate kinase
MKLVAVAHRIVHGGDRYTDSIIVDDAALAYLQTLIPLAPLHQSHNLAGLIGFAKAYPEVPQIACFDTGFHANLSALERALPLNKSLRDQGPATVWVSWFVVSFCCGTPGSKVASRKSAHVDGASG